MKKLLTLIILQALISYTCIYARNNQFVNQSPEKPKTGDDIVITYNADSKNAALAQSMEITLYVLCYYNEMEPVILVLKMTKTNKLWSAHFKLDKEVLITYYFDDGKSQDYNNDEVWFSLIYNENNGKW